VLLGEPGSIGTVTPLATAANDRAIAVIGCRGCKSLPGEMATAAGVALLSPSRPNGNWDGMRVPLFQPDDANEFTNTEVETLLAAASRR
jgi:phage tail sheath gpL-like